MTKSDLTPTRGVPVTLADGKERYLRYTLRAMREMRENIPDESLKAGVKIEDVPEALRIGLSHNGESLTAEQIEELVDGENLEHVLEQFTAALGAKKKTTPPSPSSRKKGTGKKKN